MKIIVVSSNMDCDGAAKSLSTFLKYLSNIQNISIDLFLFSKENLFFEIDNKVNLFKSNDVLSCFFSSYKKCFALLKGQKHRFTLFLIRLVYGFLKGKTKQHFLQKKWNYILNQVSNFDDKYDLAISYQDFYSCSFIYKKIRATKYISWNHSILEKMDLNLSIYRECAKKMNMIVCVSDEEKKSIIKCWGKQFENKVIIFSNLIDVNNIFSLSNENTGELVEHFSCFTICTIGRLVKSKNYDFAILVAEKLRQMHIDFAWFFLGQGPEKKHICSLLNQKKLNDCIFLTGAVKNPYSFIQKCNLYIQTSLYEGECITIKEARVLNKPFLSTNLPASILYNEQKLGILPLDVHIWADTISKIIKGRCDINSFCAPLDLKEIENKRFLAFLEVMKEGI